jgi:hypothetical protein
MNGLGHDSAESAAMEGFPKAHCRVVASRTFGDDAYVLLDTARPDSRTCTDQLAIGARANGSRRARVAVPAGVRPATIPTLVPFRFGVMSRTESTGCGSRLAVRSSRSQFGTGRTFSFGGVCPRRPTGHISSRFAKAASGNPLGFERGESFGLLDWWCTGRRKDDSRASTCDSAELDFAHCR